MNALPIAVLLALSAVAATAPGAAVEAVVTWSSPAGWMRSDYANGPDPVVAFENGSDRLKLAVYGAPGSAFKTVAEFMSGPAATSMGAPPTKDGTETVAGAATTVYRRKFPLLSGDPHGAGRPRFMGVEKFVVLKPAADGRFAVVSYMQDTPAPDLQGKGEKAWKRLLNSLVSPKARKP